jgi:hypothetical protein
MPVDVTIRLVGVREAALPRLNKVILKELTRYANTMEVKQNPTPAPEKKKAFR